MKRFIAVLLVLTMVIGMAPAVFAFFDEWGDGFDGYPLYELAYQEVG